MKAGPGVFTGKTGELTIYDSQKGGVLQKDSDAKTADATGEKTARTAETAGAAQQPAQMPTGTQDYQEFQEFQLNFCAET